jgi:hypothetical protein
MSFRICLVAAALLSLTGCASSSDGPTSSHAPEANSAKPAARFVCREWDRTKETLKNRTVVLQQTDKLGLTEGKKLAFDFELYEGANVVAEKEAKGHAETEDVSFHFSSEDGALDFHIFLDEMDESGLSIDGKDAGDFVCFSGHLVCSDYDRKTDALLQRTAVLTKTDKTPLEEGKKVPFALEIIEGARTFADETIAGTVQIEDVSFVFTSKDERTVFHHFMDEINESGLSIDDKDRGDFICR